MAKTIKQMIEVMTAYEEGKKIEIKQKDEDVWKLTYTPSWNWFDFDYRVKEEPKYRPYKDTEEMINDFCERSGAKRSKMGEPFIWMKDGESRILILSFEKDVVWTANCRWTMKELFETYTYLDNSPIGKKE